MESTYAGIDLGTTNSCIARIDEHGKPVVITNVEGELTTPSVVLFEEDGDDVNVVVGTAAKESAKLFPEAVVERVKRSIGEEYAFDFAGKTYNAEEISAIILEKVVNDAREFSGLDLRKFVITVPAWFGPEQRDKTAEAGRLAGLDVVAIINEPTAAAIAYGLDTARSENVLVYDLGGGTFDVTVMRIEEGLIDVVCTGGDHELGGRDWDMAVVNHLAEEFSKETGTAVDELLDDPETRQDLCIKAETAKIRLSSRKSCSVSLIHDGRRVSVKLTVEQFEALTAELLERTIEYTHEMAEEAKKRGVTNFDKILLVGGSTGMPQVKRRLEQEYLPKYPGIEVQLFDPHLAVAKGAAIYAWKHEIGEAIRTSVAEEPDWQAKDVAIEEIAKPKLGLPPSDVRHPRTAHFRHVASKSIGVKVVGEGGLEQISLLIKAGTPLPAKATRSFSTSVPDQEEMELTLLETPATDDLVDLELCTLVRTVEVALPSGLPANSRVDLTFTMGHDGRVEVAAAARASDGSLADDEPILTLTTAHFSVYRPPVLAPGRWSPLLAFAHLSERPPDDEGPTPREEMERQVRAVFGEPPERVFAGAEKARVSVPHEAEISFVPMLPGVETNPPSRTFRWCEPVHREEFRIRAPSRLEGKTIEGRVTVYLDQIVVADVPVVLRVQGTAASPRRPLSSETCRPYRRVFVSYSHRDTAIVQRIERLARALGDEFLRDRTQLRSGQDWDRRLLEMIEDADVFQLCWSRNSMRSEYVRREWEHALSLNRPNFVRPTYWEDPLPEDREANLPPPLLRRLHFQKVDLPPEPLREDRPPDRTPSSDDPRSRFVTREELSLHIRWAAVVITILFAVVLGLFVLLWRLS